MTTTEFDYLIVGAGSAGCVLANRLSADSSKTVCLLEAGGTNWHPLLHIPAGWATNFNNPKVDWGYSTAPEPQLNNRQVYWPRGKVLGGSSAINGMIYIRGVPQDFEAWAQAGASGWSWDEVLPYFRKAEKQHTHKDRHHGTEGPLFVEDVRDVRSVHAAYIDAMVEQGMPRNADFNGADQAGAGYYQFTQHNGRRWSAASAYLAKAKKRPNLTIMTHTTAKRLLFNGSVKAAGAVVDVAGREREILANQTVLCGGAINSPTLLELSGIGDQGRLEDLGIASVLHAPDVGEHLQDHLLTKAVYGTHEADSINREVQGWRLIPTGLKWLLKREGPLTTGSAPVGGFWYTREGLDAPDVQIHFASGATLYNEDGKIRALNVPAMTAVVNQSRPESRGSIHIQSNNPEQRPLIKANYLNSDLDQQTMVKGLRLLLDIFESPAMQKHITQRMAPSDESLDSDESLLNYIRDDASTVYHPTSTCSIGKVVDSNLQVMGVDGLFVADASVMPYVVSGNTNAATIMVAEKAADQLLQNGQ